MLLSQTFPHHHHRVQDCTITCLGFLSEMYCFLPWYYIEHPPLRFSFSCTFYHQSLLQNQNSKAIFFLFCFFKDVSQDCTMHCECTMAYTLLIFVGIDISQHLNIFSKAFQGFSGSSTKYLWLVFDSLFFYF